MDRSGEIPMWRPSVGSYHFRVPVDYFFWPEEKHFVSTDHDKMALQNT
jgi:hypothetical protein